MMNNTINNVSVNTLSRPWSHLKENYNFSLEELALFEEEHNGLNPDQFYSIYYKYADSLNGLLSTYTEAIFDERFAFPERTVNNTYKSVFMVYAESKEEDNFHDYPEYYSTQRLIATFENKEDADRFVEKYDSPITENCQYLFCTKNKLHIVETRFVHSGNFDENDDLGFEHRPWDCIIGFEKGDSINSKNFPTRRMLTELEKARGIKLTENGLEQMILGIYEEDNSYDDSDDEDFYDEISAADIEEDFDWDEFYENQPDYSFEPYDPYRTNRSMDAAIYMFLETFRIPKEFHEEFKKQIKNNPESRKKLTSEIGFMC